MIYGSKTDFGKAQDPNFLVSCFSAQKGIDFVFGSKEQQLPYLYTTC